MAVGAVGHAAAAALAGCLRVQVLRAGWGVDALPLGRKAAGAAHGCRVPAWPGLRALEQPQAAQLGAQLSLPPSCWPPPPPSFLWRLLPSVQAGQLDLHPGGRGRPLRRRGRAAGAVGAGAGTAAPGGLAGAAAGGVCPGQGLVLPPRRAAGALQPLPAAAAAQVGGAGAGSAWGRAGRGGVGVGCVRGCGSWSPSPAQVAGQASWRVDGDTCLPRS